MGSNECGDVVGGFLSADEGAVREAVPVPEEVEGGLDIVKLWCVSELWGTYQQVKTISRGWR